jgi:hypothetical protein
MRDERRVLALVARKDAELRANGGYPPPELFGDLISEMLFPPGQQLGQLEK